MSFALMGSDKHIGLTTAIVWALAVWPVQAEDPSRSCALTLTDALVFTGAGFETQTLSLKDGRFVATDLTLPQLDASDLWLTPPLVDAHTHTINTPDPAGDARHRRWLDQGVFFALNPSNIRPPGPTPAPRADQVEFDGASAGLTRPGGHPTQLYAGVADAEGTAYHTVSSPDEARTAVAAVAANGSMFVKLFLLNHTQAGGGDGLSAEVFLAAVTEAKRLGLRPIVHVEDAADFRLAVSARVFALMHMPYWPMTGLPDGDLMISADDAAMAAEAGVLVVPTVILAMAQFDGAELSRVLAVQRHNMTLLRAAGVRMAIGEDFIGDMHDEIAALRSFGLFDGPEVLRMATENGAAIAFPDRQIGRLSPGNEASLLIYRANPIQDWIRLRSPAAGLRAGHVLIDSERLLTACDVQPSG